MAGRRALATACTRLLLALTCLFAPLLWPTQAQAQLSASGSSEVGVVVEAPPATQAPRPPVTTSPTRPPSTTPPGTPTTPPTTAPVTTPTFDGGAATGTAPKVADPAKRPGSLDSDAAIVSPYVPPAPAAAGPVQAAKSAISGTKRLVKSLVGKEDTSDVAAEVLSKDVAAVVVPAIKAGSTFAFPLGLAIAVLAFLAIQRRIDSGDPKLIAAPMGHEDDVVLFR